jgi:hypothetical protein
VRIKSGGWFGFGVGAVLVACLGDQVSFYTTVGVRLDGAVLLKDMQRP